ncbi:carboxymuconolactone decarboxylase family protein [Rhodocaloribacter sp.]
MLRTLIHRRLDAEAEHLGGSMDYLRHIADTSLSAFFTFMRFMPLARRRRVLPEAAHAVAHLTAARAADCGDCVQIGVTMARRAGVSPEAIRAVLEGRSADLPAPLDDVAAFARAVLHREADPEPLRERLRARFGDEGLIELGFALASGGVFPVLKRTLGYDTACRLIDLDLEETGTRRNAPTLHPAER